jgi:hypothetical protein
VNIIIVYGLAYQIHEDSQRHLIYLPKITPASLQKT